jgi:histidinol-phosphate aminotransferase
MYPIVVKGMGAVAGAGAARRRARARPRRDARGDHRRTRVVFVCNPNNPTGTSVGAAAFDAFVGSLPAELVLVVDEAYREFARRPDFPTRSRGSRRRPGTIVMRTFSKIYGSRACAWLRRLRRRARRLPEPRAPSRST